MTAPCALCLPPSCQHTHCALSTLPAHSPLPRNVRSPPPPGVGRSRAGLGGGAGNASSQGTQTLGIRSALGEWSRRRRRPAPSHPMEPRHPAPAFPGASRRHTPAPYFQPDPLGTSAARSQMAGPPAGLEELWTPGTFHAPLFPLSCLLPYTVSFLASCHLGFQ